MNLYIDTLCKNFTITTTGSGSESVTNGILTVNAVLADTAYRTCRYAGAEGEILIYTCEGRVLTNNGTDPKPGLFIDHPSFPNSQNSLHFDSNHWKYYELKFVVPANHTKTTDFITFGAGSWLVTDGSAEIRNPRLGSESISPMNPSIWAYAWVSISNTGVVTILEQNNIASAAWTSGAGSSDSVLLVTVPGIPAGLNVAPRPKAMGTTTGGAGYIPKTSSTITGGANGQFNVKILDAATGLFIQNNPSSDTEIYIEVSY